MSGPKKQSRQVRCAGCGDKYPATTVNGEINVPACSLQCAGEILLRIMMEATIRGWDWKDYLPDDKRPDQVPWDAWQSATKLHGKKHWRKL